jgi:uncharacterized paraquat-inducible protein A
MDEKQYIEREMILQHLSDQIEAFGDPNEDAFPLAYGGLLSLKYAKSVVATAPEADVAPVVHARWIDRDGKTWCSRCDASNKQYKPPYCPHCGARMDGGERKEQDNV